MRSVPGVLISRDGTVREYVGHSSQSGTTFGRVDRDERSWIATCWACKSRFWGVRQTSAVIALRDHWKNGDYTKGYLHRWTVRS